MIGGIVLSAGESRRMGHPKALLKIKSTNFVNYIIDGLIDSGVKDVVTVLGHDCEKISAVIDNNKSDIIINENYKEGQLSSMLSGIRYFASKNAEAVIVCLVDHPVISKNLIKKIIASYENSDNSIVVPVYEGKRGHPVLFAEPMFKELEKASPHVGAREVLWNNKEKIFELKVNDPGILVGVNSPEEYRKNMKWFE